MKEYLKMADVKSLRGELASDGVSLVMGGDRWFGDMVSEQAARAAAHAINSHDELVVEVERLRRQLAYAFMAGWEEGINGMECDEAEVASVEIAEQFARN